MESYDPAQYGAADGGIGIVGLLIYGAILAIVIVSLWKIFTKASEPGWAAIVPIYNFIVLLKVAGKPWWWIFLFLIPIVNFIISIIVYIDLGKNFGKGTGFGIGLAFLPFIFLPILAFGSATYQPQAQ